MVNNGEFDQYWVQNNHEPIIDQDTFDAVQVELALRRRYGRAVTPTGGSNALTSLIECSECGRHYHRRTKTRPTHTYKFWWCWTATRGSGNPCHAPQLRENLIQDACVHALGLKAWDEHVVVTGIEAILARPDRTLEIHLADGTTTTTSLAGQGCNPRT